jgi:hypothetical protein
VELFNLVKLGFKIKVQCLNCQLLCCC